MQVKIKPINAKLTRDTDTFTRMDPYIVVTSGTNKQQTQCCNEGGLTPTWNETLTFNNAAGPNFNVQVWDKDNLSDDLVGEGLLQVNPNGGAGNYSVQVFYKGQSAGTVFLSVEAGIVGGMGGGCCAHKH